MFDPVSLIGIATTAFNGIKAAVQMGREIEDVVGQLSKWSEAIADLDKAEQLIKRKKASLFRSMLPKGGKSVQAQAMEVFAAKRKATQMRDELRQLIQYSTGHRGWEDFLRIENQIKKERQDAVYAEIERREKLKEFMLASLVVGLACITVVGIFWLGLAIHERYSP